MLVVLIEMRPHIEYDQRDEEDNSDGFEFSMDIGDRR